MRIGILTFHKSINCGSVLQAYALSEFLRSNGHEAVIINYEPKEYRNKYGIIDKSLSVASIKKNIFRLLILDVLYKQKREFERFQNNYLNVDRIKYTHNSDFEQLNTYFECIICGSDQIWNVRAVDCDPIYFLPIKHKGKKIAYSVSINDTDFSEEVCNEQLKQKILDFDMVSLREYSGAAKLASFLDNKKEIKVALDPTLLHDKNVYDKLLIGRNRLVEKPYIFMYSVNGKNDVIKAAKMLSEKYMMPVYTLVVTRSAAKLYKIFKAGLKIVRRSNGPLDFIKYISNAQMVVTNSFHGTAYSLIYEKQFISINDIMEKDRLCNDERIMNILSMVGLEERYISIDKVKEFNVMESINYCDITKLRMEKAEDSKSLLLSQIDM